MSVRTPGSCVIWSGKGGVLIRLDELSKDEESSRINESLVSQTACTALQIALADLLASWGIRPQKVIGHSSGEIAAAYAAGILRTESALKAAYFRGLHSSLLQTKLPSVDGAMMAVGLSEKDADAYIEALDPAFGRASVACINSPTNVTVSGDRPALVELGEAMRKDRVVARLLKVSTAYHSHHMKAVADDYEQSLAGMEVLAPTDAVEMISTVTGRSVTPSDFLGPKYWRENMVSPVRFNDGLQALFTKGCRTVDLYEVNAPEGLQTIQPQVVVDLPPYFWNHSKTHWAESRLSLEHRFRRHARTDFLGYPVSDWNPMEPRWRNLVRLREQPWIKGHVVQGSYVYPGTGYLCMAIEALQQLRRMPEHTVP